MSAIVANDLIDSTEMYLRTVLELEEEGIPALRARLADRLGLSAPSVSEGVARLEKDGLLVLTKDRTVALTDEGRAKAESVMRKHRLAERLLVDVLGVEHEFVHEEACRWEHVISDHVEEKLIAFLGEPTASPYGNPIPGMGGDGDARGPADTLAKAPDGPVRIDRFSERIQGDHEVMHDLDAHGVTVGDVVEIEHDDDAVLVRVGGGQVRVPADAAKYVYVSPVSV